MLAISSCRQLSVNDEIAQNQIRANKSWQKQFDAICYFTEPDARLANNKTRFVRGEDFPAIKSLLLMGSLYDDIGVILNADIVVSESFRQIVHGLIYGGTLALTSMRYEFDPTKENYDDATIADHGVDFFAAVPMVWKKAWREIPAEYRIGHGGWDSWMLGFLNYHCGHGFKDITKHRCIFHPKHGSRHAPHSFNAPNPIFSHLCMFPSRA